jgi:RNA polymerase sigma-70 factor, ECF subfamily
MSADPLGRRRVTTGTRPCGQLVLRLSVRVETEPQKASGPVTTLLHRVRQGDLSARDELLPLVLDELRRLARGYLRRERDGHTLQATALINEAYIRLAGLDSTEWRNRAHFIGTAAQAMRQILVDYARRHRSRKRGDGRQAEDLVQFRETLSREQSREIVALDDALKALEKLNQRQARIVEMRYFGGLTAEETAEALGISGITVKRDWAMARAWLEREVERR